MNSRTTCTILFAVCAGATTALADPPVASFTITEGSSAFVCDGLMAGAPGRTGAAGGAGAVFGTTSEIPVDHMIQNWFWYRTTGDAREYGLSNQVESNVLGNHARLVYVEPAGDGTIPGVLRIELEYTITDLSPLGGGDEAQVVIAFVVRNLSPTIRNTNFFSYSNMNLNGTILDTSVVSGAAAVPQLQTIRDPGGGMLRAATAYYSASGSFLSHYRNGEAPAVLPLLVDIDLDNLPDAAPLVGPTDYAGAFQWTRSLQPAGTASDMFAGSVALRVRAECRCDFNRDGVVDSSDFFDFLACFFTGC